jgi:glutamate/tyrosine decarboxylase-like PLP-dependent enzyme
LRDLLALRERYEFRVHADAAYGGYFGLAGELHPDTAETYSLLQHVDSIVVDPHKHGLQPYGCGCVLFRDPSVGAFYKHGSPYTYFSSAELHLGEISMECSRPGASAVALWATQKLFPLQPGGEFSRGLDKCLLAAREFWQRLKGSDQYQPLMPPELDIVVYALKDADSEAASKHARQVFETAAEKDLHLALIELPAEIVSQYMPGMRVNGESVTCLRSVLMKPEHGQWLDQIMGILEESARIRTTPK